MAGIEPPRPRLVVNSTRDYRAFKRIRSSQKNKFQNLLCPTLCPIEERLADGCDSAIRCAYEQSIFRHETIGGCVNDFRDDVDSDLNAEVGGNRRRAGTEGRVKNGRCDADQAGGRKTLRDHRSHAGELDGTGLCAISEVRAGYPIQSRGRANACGEAPPDLPAESLKENAVFGALPALRARGSGEGGERKPGR
jgi:hypothetical protein